MLARVAVKVRGQCSPTIEEFLMYSSEYRYGIRFPYLVVKSLYGFGTNESIVPAEQHSPIT